MTILSKLKPSPSTIGREWSNGVVNTHPQIDDNDVYHDTLNNIDTDFFENPINDGEDTFYDAVTDTFKWVKDKISSIFHLVKDKLLRVFGFLKDKTSSRIRRIGIRVRDILKTLLDVVRNGIETMGPKLLELWNTIEGLINKVIDSDLVTRIIKLALKVQFLPFNIAVQRICATLISTIVLIVNQFINSSMTKRILVAVITIATSYLSGCGCLPQTALIATFIETLRQLSDFGKQQVRPQVTSMEVRDDIKEFTLAALGCITSLYCCSLGLELPTDAKSLDALLKRHSLLGNAFKAWDKIAQYFSDLFMASLKIITKYIFREQWIAPHHIEEIENLYYEVMELTRLDKTFQLGRNIELSYKVEGLYHNFLYLRKIYSGNKEAIQKLDLISGPLTTMYKTVSMSNPRSMVMRKEPVCIVLKGRSGIGKSYMITPLQQALLKINGTYQPDLDLSGFIYSRAAENEFWDSYKGQPVVIYDDFGQKVDSQQNPNPEFFELIRGVNIFPWQLHSAAIHEKANNPMQADFFVLTTNLPNFDNVPSIISDEALNRRLHLIYTVDILEEVTFNGKLSIAKLEEYRRRNNLSCSDNSHYRFRNERTGSILRYEDILREISLQYKQHLESFVQRTNMANETAEETLPEGVFSANPRWRANPQVDMSQLRIPLAFFLRFPRSERRRMLNNGIRVFEAPLPSQYNDIILNHETLVALDEELNLDPLVFYQYDRSVLTYLSEDYPEYDWNKLLKWWWRGKNGMTSANVATILQFRAGKFCESIRWFWDTIKMYVGFFAICYGFHVMYKYVTSKECFAKIPAWTYWKTLMVYYSTAGIAQRVGFLSQEVLGIPIALLVDIGGIIMHAKCIAANFFECRCDECSGHKIMEQIKKKYPDIVDILDNDNPETLRRLKSLAQKMKETEHESERAQHFKKNEQRYEGNLVESVRDPHHRQIKERYEEDTNIESSREPHHKRVVQTYESELDISAKTFLESERANGDRKRTKKGVWLEASAEAVISHTSENIAAKVRRQTLLISYKNSSGTWKRMGHCFVICGQYAAINAHFYQYLKAQNVSADSELKFTAIGHTEGFFMTVRQTLQSARRIYRGVNETEFYLIKLDHQPFCNMLKHFMSVQESSKLTRGVKVRMVTSSKEGEKYIPMNRDGTYLDTQTIRLPDLSDEKVTHIYPNCGAYDICTQEGDCGSVLLANSDMFNGKIFGLHHSGRPGQGFCSLIFKEDLIKLVEDTPIVSEPNIERDGFERCDVELPFDGAFFPIGKAERPVFQPCTTKLCPSEIFEAFGPTKVAPAVLEPALKPDGPMIKGLLKYKDPSHPLDPTILEMAVKSYEDKLYSCAPPMELETSVLTLEEACAGITGNEFFPPLNKTKSAGFPLCFESRKGKQKWFGSGDWDFSRPEWLELKKELMEEESMLKQGVIPNYVFVDTLKDEKRPLEKIREKKTRVFSAAPMKFSILFRKYYAGFLAYCTRTRIDNEIAVGTSASSNDWGRIVNVLQFNTETPTMIAGDFSNFDGTVHYQIYEKIGEMIDRWYNDEHSKIRRLLWGCISQAKHLCCDLVYQMTHGQPSGNPSTAVSNSIYNSIALRCVIGKIKGLEVLRDFNKLFKMVAYGDDNIISVHPSLLKELKPSQVAEGFSNLGMTYTSEDKDEIKDMYRTINQVTFLKRGFVYDQERNWWFAPLSLDSIREMCYWIHKSPNHLDSTKLNCVQAAVELTMHDKETFVDMVVKIRKALRKKGTDISTIDWNIGRDMIAAGSWKQLFTDDMCWM